MKSMLVQCVKRFACVLLLLFAVSQVIGQADREKSLKVDRIIAITLDTTLVNEIWNWALESSSSITKNVWNEIFGVNSEVRDEVIEIAREFYLSEFTTEEIDEILNFFDSEVGQKIRNSRGKLYTIAEKHSSQWAADKFDSFEQRIDSTRNELGRNGDCAKIKMGNFEYTENVTLDSIQVERSEDRQIEYLPEGIAEYEIEWMGQCHYKLTCLKYIDESYARMIGVESEVKVFEISENGYRYLVKAPEFGYADISELRILKQ